MTTETFRPFDPAEYLETEEDVLDYLEAAAEDGDSRLMLHALAAVARARNMTELAHNTGMTRAGLYKALSATGNPSFSTVAKLAKALDLEISFRPHRAREKGPAVSP